MLTYSEWKRERELLPKWETRYEPLLPFERRANKMWRIRKLISSYKKKKKRKTNNQKKKKKKNKQRKKEKNKQKIQNGREIKRKKKQRNKNQNEQNNTKMKERSKKKSTKISVLVLITREYSNKLHGDSISDHRTFDQSMFN